MPIQIEDNMTAAEWASQEKLAEKTLHTMISEPHHSFKASVIGLLHTSANSESGFLIACMVLAKAVQRLQKNPTEKTVTE